MKVEQIEYFHGETVLEACVSYDVNKTEKRPGVFIFHAWNGRDDFVCEKAKMLAELGYVGLALDIYGKGVLGKNAKESAKLMEPFIADRNLLRARMHAGIEAMQDLPYVDHTRLGAIGFCFGGLCAIDLARSGADIKGIMSFHGLLHAPKDVKSKSIRAKVFVLHGHDDPMVPPEEVLAFAKEMTEAGVDWQIHTYGQTMHAFMNPSAKNPSDGKVYSPLAEKRSLQTMQNFFTEIF